MGKTKKRRKTRTSPLVKFLGIGIILGGLVGGGMWLTPRVSGLYEELTGWPPLAKPITIEELKQSSSVLALASLKPEKRAAQLQQLAAEENILARSRARYLLASDLIDQYEGGQALRYLEGLEKYYPVLAPYILLKRGRGYELTNESAKAQATWKKLMETYSDSPVVVDALAMLGKYNAKYWEQAKSEFPYHPRTLEIVRMELQEKPDDPKLLVMLARVGRDYSTNQIRDRLVLEFASELTPEDWQAIADGYWQFGETRKAADAYGYAPMMPRNLYRAARGLELNGNTEEAKSKYRRLAQEFHDADETGVGLLHLASLSTRQQAVGYLDLVISKFPPEAPTALLKKAAILEKLNNKESAALMREKLLKEYPNSEAAVEYRWSVAEKLAEAGNIQGAYEWVQPLTENTKQSDLSAKAAFWAGKWAKQLGKEAEAEATFKYVLTNQWQSYYGWRSAVMLGRDVGDFTTLREKIPQVNQPYTRPVPPAGSEVFKELFRLGQDEDAQILFLAEIGDRQELSVVEQFSQGLLLQVQEEYRNGIMKIWSLSQRENPRDVAQWLNLRQTEEYWQGLFPFPYYDDIRKFATEHQVNPLLVISLIRQESTFEWNARSTVGATGLMQIMPATGEWAASEINLQGYSLTNPEDNINLGSWYLNHTHQQYNNNSLLAVASYNAGPGNVSSWVKKYGFDDPDVFVENIPFPETQGYVEAVFSNYWNYLRIYNPEISQLLATESEGENTAQINYEKGE
ncbi:MAG: transglycosylase SLT domain-containing protein [Gomphosphaeria aponina SAG 52.96 = DSM 107014]|uniref:Transglycosylase SLT domain-containing protein n=1 Tax=Gomphosphaeria aponina SAG 52.96 = DSM 107014 TaxID=1521640 RepID=A0A941JS15_9CHRO|nr:transglycosylase SLT domain-containing protein [Gomphosphaeria aponina SAG 52.96 = DSM 107014]